MTLELAPTPTAVLVEGGVGCGKTTALIARAATLLEDGAVPKDMLVLTATPDAARVLAARLIEVVGERGGAVKVTYTRDVALGLLASEEGRAFSGRAGRLVTPVRARLHHGGHENKRPEAAAFARDAQVLLPQLDGAGRRRRR